MAIRGRRSTLGAVLALLALGVALARGRVRRFEIAEESMQPALDPGDYVIAVRLQKLARGTVVVYPHPDSPGFDMVKRVVGLPNETVVIANGQVHVDGRVLAEPWADGPTVPDGKWELGTADLFVLGDARSVSAGDSRSIGPVSRSDARWRVAWRYWPVGRAGRI